MDLKTELVKLKKLIGADEFGSVSRALESVHGLLDHVGAELKKKTSPVDPELESKIKEIDELVNAPEKGLKDQLALLTKAFFDLKEELKGLPESKPEAQQYSPDIYPDVQKAEEVKSDTRLE